MNFTPGTWIHEYRFPESRQQMGPVYQSFGHPCHSHLYHTQNPNYSQQEFRNSNYNYITQPQVSNFDYRTQGPDYQTQVEINNLKNLINNQNNKINELITIVNILKSSTQSIIKDYLNHLKINHSTETITTTQQPEETLIETHQNSEPQITIQSIETTVLPESDNESEYDYGELDSDIESDTDTEEYKQLVEETYNKIFVIDNDEIDEKNTGLGSRINDFCLGKRKRGRPVSLRKKQKVSFEEGIKNSRPQSHSEGESSDEETVVSKDTILKEIKCPNTKSASSKKSYIVSNYKIENIFPSINKKYNILELSNKKKYIFAKDFSNKFYRARSGLTNIVRRNLKHETDYVYIKYKGIEHGSKHGNGVRLLLTKSGLQTVILCIRKSKNSVLNNMYLGPCKNANLLQEYLELANELD